MTWTEFSIGVIAFLVFCLAIAAAAAALKQLGTGIAPDPDDVNGDGEDMKFIRQDFARSERRHALRELQRRIR